MVKAPSLSIEVFASKELDPVVFVLVYEDIEVFEVLLLSETNLVLFVKGFELHVRSLGLLDYSFGGL